MSVQRCPACHAPLRYNAVTCEYCGTHINVDLSLIHKFEEVEPEETRFCPSCRIPMKTLNVAHEGKFLIEQCPRCYGIFFDEGELDRMLEGMEIDAARVNMDVINAQCDAAVPPAEDRALYVFCPICRKLMNRRRYGLRSGIVMDVCRHHGVWLDAGELSRIVDWKKAGGDRISPYKNLHEEIPTSTAECYPQHAQRGKADLWRSDSYFENRALGAVGNVLGTLAHIAMGILNTRR